MKQRKGKNISRKDAKFSKTKDAKKPFNKENFFAFAILIAIGTWRICVKPYLMSSPLIS